MIHMTAEGGTVDLVSHLIQLSVAPVFLLAGVGALLGVFTGRFSRIIDKAEKLNERLQEQRTERSGVDRRTDELRAQRNYLAKRARNMNHAIMAITLTGFLVASVIMVMFLSAFLEFNGAVLIATLFLLAMTAFMIGLLLFLREIYMAFYNLRNGN